MVEIGIGSAIVRLLSTDMVKVVDSGIVWFINRPGVLANTRVVEMGIV